MGVCFILSIELTNLDSLFTGSSSKNSTKSGNKFLVWIFFFSCVIVSLNPNKLTTSIFLRAIYDIEAANCLL